MVAARPLSPRQPPSIWQCNGKSWQRQLETLASTRTVLVLCTRTCIAAREGTQSLCLQIVIEDVEEAVEAALHRSRAVKWHSMR